MYIASDPKGKVYLDLIEFSFTVCDEFILVIRPDMTVSKYAKTVLDRLSLFLKERRDQLEWPGTRLGVGSKPVSVYYYRTDEEALKILFEVSESLHSWQHPRLPEDLCFLKNHKPWLINSAHESESYFDTDDKDEIEQIMNIENLEVRTLKSLKCNFPKVFSDNSLNMQCIFCKGNFHEGDIVPEKWFVCLKCINNGLLICEEDRKIFNEQSVNRDTLIIDIIQILKVADFDLLESITEEFNSSCEKVVCSKRCFNLLYINDCIRHLQTCLAMILNKESSELIDMIKDNENIEDILMNKIDELEGCKQKIPNISF
ncbi:hypothetical protein [Desulfosporosinus shakirovi]|uniref:hypothetical protein n=1 Tax=Desulfosporosinus shakirovi TaxID=2885154 RepID=UPI001E62A5E4|nr:hypothetical protein [Desulfosporosinus sp. SRJS8]MCB8818907.1 hypothetical protein [Desulfosporosinus sp. SRJS8]